MEGTSNCQTKGDHQEYEHKRKKLRQIWQGYIYRYQNVSFYEAVRQGIPSWTDEDANKFGALGIGSGGFGPLFPVNFLEFLRIVANGWEENQQLLPFGISTFIENFTPNRLILIRECHHWNV
ncbi:MAG: hypothetical protein HC907_38660 [Richelia sp. SM1_7_0]|nr:hypothetical protein [Richelia sp. SM1_7_0]